MSLDNRYDFVMIFDVENGNPNGDPDAGNSPRVDAETGIGYVTDVCLKRKIRNYVELVAEEKPRFNILIKADKVLNAKFKAVYEELWLKQKKKDKNIDDVKAARDYICKNYYDVRVFGAVMSTGDNPCGIVRGPVQINFAKSVSPISIEDVTITRLVRTKEDSEKKGENEFGRKSIIPYALYRAEGYVSAALANKTGVDSEDIELLWNAIINMFENDHSAARGKMCMRKLIIFKHDSILGSTPSHVLFDKVKILKKGTKPPRQISDYEISIDRDMPDGVELIEKL